VAPKRPKRPFARKYRVIDLFCGAGGFTLGFKSTGRFESVLANDFDYAAAATYMANFDGPCVEGDIHELLNSDWKLPAADVVIGGPPCQGFSLLNKKKQGDPRKELWRAYMKVVDLVRPAVFVMENVPELLKSGEFEQIRSTATRLGYETTYGILNAADYGVPQRRKRAIVIAALHGHPSLPEPTHIAPDQKGKMFDNGRIPWKTVRSAIGDLPPLVGTEIRPDPPPLDLHFGRSPTKESRERYRCVPEGGNRVDLQRERPDLTPKCWIHKKGGTDLFGRLWWDRPAFTIRTEFYKPEKGRYLHPSRHRPITHREAARLMSFPDDFLFLGGKIEIARQIGNAVPPLLAQRIAESVIACLDAVPRSVVSASGA
jgi:DNA (cytosine-5)-methyltransferase 1